MSPKESCWSGEILEKLIRESKEQISQMAQQNHHFIKSYRKTCSKINFIIKLVRYALPHLKDRRRELQAELLCCMKGVKTFLCSLEPDKYAHYLPLLANLVSRYERQQQLNIPLSTEQLLKQIQCNRLEEKQKGIQNFPISFGDIKFLKPENKSNFFIHVTKNSQKLQDHQCLGCTQIFFMHSPIFNYNPVIPMFIGLAFLKFIDSLVLKKYLNAIANQGGGIILIGTKKKGGATFPDGIQFSEETGLQENEKQIRNALMALSPPCNFLIQKVNVNENYESLVPRTQEVRIKICFRISLYPQEARRISYIQTTAKGYQPVTEIYFLNKEHLPEKLETQIDLYQIMHKRYRLTKARKNSHQNIECYRPPAVISCSENKQNYYRKSSRSAQSTEPVFIDEPQFQFKNSSILAVSCKKEERQIQKLVLLLKKEKKMIRLTKPFHSSFSFNSRSIWMLCHDMTTLDLKESLKSFEFNKQIKKDSINVMPVHKTLQIERHKLSQHNEQLIKRKFFLRYDEEFRAQTTFIAKQGQKQVIIFYMMFNDFSQAIYAYLLCEELNIRPYFVRESSVSKNKGMKKVP